MKLAPQMSDRGLTVVKTCYRRDKDGYLRSLIMEGGKIRSIPHHRLVARLRLGRWLAPTEIVHHRNGDKDDNQWENFLIVSPQEHGRLRSTRRKSASPYGGSAVSPEGDC